MSIYQLVAAVSGAGKHIIIIIIIITKNQPFIEHGPFYK